MLEPKIAQVRLLIQQNRFADAEKILASMLAEEPNNVVVLTMYAEVKLENEDFAGALALVDAALAQVPDWANLHFLKARIFGDQDKYAAAENCMSQAITLDPSNADFHAYQAALKLEQKEFQQALEMADRSLQLDAENLLAQNMRSTALLKLGRKDEATAAIEGALHRDPNNAVTHATFGWSALEQGQHIEAMEHFRESLKLDPNSTYAQAGMLQAIKAKYFIYRIYLKYAFWMGNMKGKQRWMVIIGFYVAFRVLQEISKNVEALQPLLVPLLVLLGIVAFSTWIISPLSNLFLRLHPYGQYLLDEEDKLGANYVGVSLGIFLASALLLLLTWDEVWLAPMVYGFVMMLPLSVMLTSKQGRRPILPYAFILGALGLLAIVTAFLSGVLFNTFTLIFFLAFFAFQWLANYLLMRAGGD